MAGCAGATRRSETATGAVGGYRAAFLVALGIGLHNLGEGLAIGSAYASARSRSARRWSSASRCTTPPRGWRSSRPSRASEARFGRLAGLGLLAGAPAVLGAWIGASAFDPTFAALMFGIGAGAIARVIVQIAPSIRDRAGQLLNPVAAGGALAGLAAMYATGLLVSV